MTAETATENARSETLAVAAQAGQLGLVGSSTLSVPAPFETRICLFESIRVAGTAHALDIDGTMSAIYEGAFLRLVRETGNFADAWAIRVEFEGSKIGYVPADKSEVLARLMDGGKALEGKLVEFEKLGTWWRAYMEVDLVD